MVHTNDSRLTDFTTCKCKYFCLFIMLYQIMYMAQNVLLDNSRKYPYHTYHGPLPHFNPSPFPPCPQNSITVTPPSPPPLPFRFSILNLNSLELPAGSTSMPNLAYFVPKYLCTPVQLVTEG